MENSIDKNEIEFSSYAVFTDKVSGLSGNTSTVVILDHPLSRRQMQDIASDLWQPATTFLWKEDNHWQVRWFAPDQEIGLCGHGSMAAVACLHDKGITDFDLHFNGGIISGGVENDRCYITLEVIPVVEKLKIEDYLQEALKIPILGHYQTSNKNIILTDNQESVKSMRPNFEILRSSPIFGYAVTAPGDHCDFVSRTLVPHVHQLEDPATGSSHAALAPFWASILHKTEMEAIQLSQRGGKFHLKMQGTTVRLSGDHDKLNAGTIYLR
ncbi:PhzF family phenazine biosynthesis protein [Marinoscillum sp.]|uniref:PhzF family phenazine biosynthesis protein n=1 Tax=Marinoscillum sp. TaxID=2024838 RepID=UPI003BA99EF8